MNESIIDTAGAWGGEMCPGHREEGVSVVQTMKLHFLSEASLGWAKPKHLYGGEGWPWCVTKSRSAGSGGCGQEEAPELLEEEDGEEGLSRGSRLPPLGCGNSRQTRQWCAVSPRSTPASTQGRNGCHNLRVCDSPQPEGPREAAVEGKQRQWSLSVSSLQPFSPISTHSKQQFSRLQPLS